MKATPVPFADRAEVRRAAERMFALAESAREEGRWEDAARLFGRSAGTLRSTGDVLEAADAYVELGGVLLSQGRGRLLPELAVRLLDLLSLDPLPKGATLALRVFAAIMTHGALDHEPFQSLVQERRRCRVRGAEESERRSAGDLRRSVRAAPEKAAR